jgi:hypothetical protein
VNISKPKEEIPMPTDCKLSYPETFPMSCMTAIIDIALKREAKSRMRELVLHSTNIVLYLTGMMLPEKADDEVTPIGAVLLSSEYDDAATGCLRALEDIITEPQVSTSQPVAILPIFPLITLLMKLLRLYLEMRR